MFDLSPNPKFKAFVDGTSIPLAGGKLFTYAAGTSANPANYQTTYKDSVGTANTNPVILDSNGECDLWLGDLAYKYVLTDSVGNELWTEDNIVSGTGSITLKINELFANNFAALALKPASVGQVVTVISQSSGNVGGNQFVGFSSAGLTPDGYSVSESATAGIYWKRSIIGFSSKDDSGSSYSLSIDRVTAVDSDGAFGTHTVSGAGQGYGVHMLDTGSSTVGDPYGISFGNSGAGGAGGFATDRTTPADAIVANRRLGGDGSGLVGTRWETGNGNGVMGVMRGSGTGDAVFGYKVLNGLGHGVRGYNVSTGGDGVTGYRDNNAGNGNGISGYAHGSAGINNASVYGYKLAGDGGYAIFGDSRGTDPAGYFFTANNVAVTLSVASDVTNTGTQTVLIDKQNGKLGTGQKVTVSGNGARTAAVIATQSFVVPATSTSTGTGTVTAHDAQISSSVTGSSDTRAISATNSATSGTAGYGVLGLSTGANTTNYAVYGNATGGTTNYSGYFVGNLFYGGSLIPSDSRLKDIHGQVDTAQMLANVLACPVYCYDKHSAWDENILDEDGNIVDVVEMRAVLATNEIGPIAQELQAITPDHVNSTGKYLAVSDRSEMYQMKAAIQELHKIIMEMKNK